MNNDPKPLAAPVSQPETCELCHQPLNNGWIHGRSAGYGDFATLSCSITAGEVAAPLPEIASPSKFTKKRVTIEAAQFLEGQPIPKGVCFGWSCGVTSKVPHVHTIHAGQRVDLMFGDWVIPEGDGEHFYPVKEDVFASTYDPAVATPAPLGEGANGMLSYDGRNYIFLHTEDGPTIFAEIRGYGAGLDMDANANRIVDLWNAALASKAVPTDVYPQLWEPDWENVGCMRKSDGSIYFAYRQYVKRTDYDFPRTSQAVPVGEGEDYALQARKIVAALFQNTDADDVLRWIEAKPNGMRMLAKFAVETQSALLQSNQREQLLQSTVDSLRGGKFSERDWSALKSRAEVAEATLARLRSQLADIQEWWRTHIGDGTAKFSIGELNSLYEDFQLELARLRSQEGAQWIDCKQELPPYGVPVWVVHYGVVQHIAYSRDIGEWSPCGCDDADAAPDGTFSHWQRIVAPGGEGAKL